MNAHAAIQAPVVRTANLGDPDECRRIRAFVLTAPGAEPFHFPEWSQAIERGCGQRSFYLLAEQADGALAAVLPLSAIRSRLFGSALVSAGFGVGGGILGGGEVETALLAEAACALARAQGCASVELRGGEVPVGFEAREGVYAGFARALASDDEAMLKAIPRKQRAEVRRAQGLNMAVTVGRDNAARRAHFAVYAQSVRNLGTPVFPPALFDAMLEFFGDEADILTVRHGGSPVASVLSFYCNGTVYPYWGGGTHQARALRANELMYFELMRHAAARGCTRFDFGRSKCGTGAFAYKKNWGFEPQPLRYALRSLDGAAPREINPLSPKYRLQVALWRKLPLALANRIGPLIARGLG